MLDREACERRVYRLAALLTGNPLAATAVIAQVVDAQPDLAELDSAHMDRLTVLRSREVPAATLVSDLAPPAVADALSGLTPQQREAWVFARVYRTPPREMARAMDCSTHAGERHLQLADAALQAALGRTAEDAAPMLLAYSMSLDVPQFYRAARARRRRMRLAVRLVLTALAATLVTMLVMWWARPFDGDAARNGATATDSSAATQPAATSAAP